MSVRLFFIFFLAVNFAEAQALKTKKPTPFQAAVNKCFNSGLNIQGLNSNKKVYLEIVKNFSLQASETIFREVEYAQAGEKRKLRLEDGEFRIYKIDSEDKVTLISTENMNTESKNNGLRYKIGSIEAKMAQLLNKADIKSDFSKTIEYRAKQLVLIIVWTDSEIKSLVAQFGSEKDKLTCQKKESVDICDCSD